MNSNADNKSSSLSPSVVSSMLWAASADAMGWTTELIDGPDALFKRAGTRRVESPVLWRKKVGGWAGVDVVIPAGTYSDDTQLRLSVCRAIRGDGSFDVEAFAKVELPVWQNYALGAGLGSKAAAANMGKRGVNWFSNFFETKKQSYIRGGGNGAAMRIQPHVWASRPGALDKMVLAVFRDSIVTHGNPHGFCGAYFHALCLFDVFEDGDVPGPAAWGRYANALLEIPDRIAEDSQLSSFWLSNWEDQSGTSIASEMKNIREVVCRDIDAIERIAYRDSVEGYHDILDALGCFKRELRGSGIKTALAAAALSWLHKSSSVKQAIIAGVNEFGSDTDTIATMAASISGALAEPPGWTIQDRNYLEMEASRLQSIRSGAGAVNFVYPDLSKWRVPGSQVAAVVCDDKGLALTGLGRLAPCSDIYSSGDDCWQWMRLPFGQTVFSKRKKIVSGGFDQDQFGSERSGGNRPTKDDLKIMHNMSRSRRDVRDSRDFKSGAELSFKPVVDPPADNFSDEVMSIDEITASIIRGDFSPLEIGRAMVALIDSTNSIELPVALAAVIAKARIARNRKLR